MTALDTRSLPGEDSMTSEQVDPRLDQERTRIAQMVAQAGVIQVTSAEENDAAAVMLQELKGRAKDLDTLRRSMTRPLDDAKRRIMDLFRPIEQEMAEVEQHLKGTMLDWRRQEERRLAELQRAADEERQRLAAEAAKAAEEGRVADAIVAAADSLAVPNVPKAVANARGTSVTPTYRAEVESLQDLVLAVAAGEAPLNLLTANQSALNALARATKQEGVVVPGVRFLREDTMSARAAVSRGAQAEARHRMLDSKGLAVASVRLTAAEGATNAR